MCAGDCVEITGEVQVHLLHRHNLRVSAASRTTLHAKTRAQGRFADTNRGVLANAVQTVTQTDRGGCLAFARRCRIDRCDQDQFAVFARLQAVDERLTNLGLIVALRQQMFGCPLYSSPIPRD